MPKLPNGRSGSVMSEINITPFVDVMLVLLIIFMITTPMMGKGVDIELPKADAQPMEVDESKLVMTIDSERRVFLGETLVPNERLEEALLSNERLQREGELYLQADQNIPYGFVVQVMAIVKKAGIPKLGMITDPMQTDWPPTADASAP
ncbi:MAG: biopolymer transporter ExbD [Proteobacteria bacterium]|jgi:biopolymer transport protein TolR|nr:biopolymer transporter ExbD [Pseudomonadota bacterium]